jgi:hypothetical protein
MADTPLTDLLTGRYNRASLRHTLAGLTVADLVHFTEESFMMGLRVKDTLFGRVLWRNVLYPVRDAFVTYETSRETRRFAAEAEQKLAAVIANVRG